MSNAVSGLQQSWLERTLREVGAASRMVHLVLDRNLPLADAVRGPMPLLEAATLSSDNNGIGGPALVLRRTVEAPNLLRDASGLIDATTKRVNAQARTGRAP